MHIIQRSHSASIKFPNFIEKFGTADKYGVAAPNIFLSPDSYRDRRRQVADSHADASHKPLTQFCWHCRWSRNPAYLTQTHCPQYKKNRKQ